MKNLFTLIALIFTVSLSAQIGKAKSEEKLKLLGGEVSLYKGVTANGKARIVISDDNTDENGNPYHMIAFQNQEYTTVRDTQVAGFFASKDDLDYLFNEMKKVALAKEIDKELYPFMSKSIVR